MHRLFAFEGVLGPDHAMPHTHKAGGIFIPSWAFSMIASVALFLSGMAVAYVKFETSTEQRLGMLEKQIQQMQDERNRDWREFRELLISIRKERERK